MQANLSERVDKLSESVPMSSADRRDLQSLMDLQVERMRELTGLWAGGEMTDDEGKAILVRFEELFAEAMAKPPPFMGTFPKDRRRMVSKGLPVEPSCELTGTIESRNRLDGHIHMIVNDAVLSQPGAPDIKAGTIKLLVA